MVDVCKVRESMVNPHHAFPTSSFVKKCYPALATCLMILCCVSGCMLSMDSDSKTDSSKSPNTPDSKIPESTPQDADEVDSSAADKNVNLIGEFPPKQSYPNIVDPILDSGKILKAFEGSADTKYKLGAGDEIRLNVWDHEEIAGDYVIGPDGEITLPVAGVVKLVGKTREEAAEIIQKALEPSYGILSVTVGIKKFTANSISIFGQVQSPGVYEFVNRPTLLAAISRAGGIFRRANSNNTAVVGEDQMMPSCGIIRGRDKFAWINLKEILYGGNLNLNFILQPDDILYISEWNTKPIYVFGEVSRPGIVKSFPNMTILDALGQVGGFTSDADKGRIQIINPGKDIRKKVSFRKLLKGDKDANTILNEGDIVFVPSNRCADIGYLLQKLTPLSWLMFYYSNLSPSPVLKYTLEHSTTDSSD